MSYVNLTPAKDGVILYPDLIKVKVDESSGRVTGLDATHYIFILYPDLIKVKVDESSGRVTGLDATHYIFNHTPRTIGSPKISLSDAAARLPLPAVGEGRLALIPMDETREVLTYEFECERDGTYFVYLDAMTGEEVNILFVVSDTERGSLLM